MAATSTMTYNVDGMSCGHCVKTVTEGVGEITGVTEVQVDLENKKVTVTGDDSVDDTSVRETIDDLGFEVQD